MTQIYVNHFFMSASSDFQGRDSPTDMWRTSLEDLQIAYYALASDSTSPWVLSSTLRLLKRTKEI